MTSSDILQNKDYFIHEAKKKTMDIFEGNIDEWIICNPIKRKVNDRFYVEVCLFRYDDFKIEDCSVRFYERDVREGYFISISSSILPFKNFKLAGINEDRVEFYMEYGKPPHWYPFLDNEDKVKLMIEIYYNACELENNFQYSIADEIKKIKSLLDEGIISENEFNAFKKKLLE